MDRNPKPLRRLVLALMAGAAIVACTTSPTTTTASSSNPPNSAGPTNSAASPSPGSACANESPAPIEPPVPIESNPPGDIPDTIQYPRYAPKGAPFTVVHPEGWARKNGPAMVTFTQNLFAMTVSWSPATGAPTVATAKTNDVALLHCTEAAFRLESIQPVQLPAGSSVLIRFQANSKPNSVTGKESRVEVFRYELYRNGTEVVLSLAAPVNSDVVDPWRTIRQGIKWN